MDSRQSVLDAIRLIVRALRVSSAATERRLGVSVAQLFVLQKLEERDGLSVNELARATLTHQSSVSVVVSKLVARRLVRRSVASGDRRMASLALTPKGRYVMVSGPKGRWFAPLDRALAAKVYSWFVSQDVGMFMAPPRDMFVVPPDVMPVMAMGLGLRSSSKIRLGLVQEKSSSRITTSCRPLLMALCSRTISGAASRSCS